MELQASGFLPLQCQLPNEHMAKKYNGYIASKLTMPVKALLATI